MTTVHPVYLDQLIVVGELDDHEAAELALRYDPNDETHMRALIRAVITPYFQRWDDDSKTEVQRVLALSLLDPSETYFAGVWEGDLPPVDLPDPPSRFFRLLWDELFGDTSPAAVLPDWQDVQIDTDPTACNRMRVAPTADAPRP